MLVVDFTANSADLFKLSPDRMNVLCFCLSDYKSTRIHLIDATIVLKLLEKMLRHLIGNEIA